MFGSEAVSQQSSSTFARVFVDEMHLAIAPAVLGSGEHLFSGLDVLALGYRCSEHVPTAYATHVVLSRN
jgi:dihydrofolate reductase